MSLPFSNLRRRLRWAAIRGGYHAVPTFLIIGAQKAGTSALFDYLHRHPKVVPAFEKELYYFAPEALRHLVERAGGAITPEQVGLFDDVSDPRGLAWYHARFPLPHRLTGGRITGEATANYLYYPAAAARIRAYCPGVRLIVLLRDPVERAYSAWNMYRDLRDPRFRCLRETRSFDEAVATELEKSAADHREPPDEPGYLHRGLYHDQLSAWFRHFPREQFLVLESRSLRDDRTGTLARVTEFLGLPSIDWRLHGPLPDVHSRPYDAPMSEASRARLRVFFAPHNRRLYDLLKTDFGWQ